MSGEGRSGRYRGPIFANPEIEGTAFQLSYIDGMVKVVPSDIKQGIMTERQLAKAVLKAEGEAERRSFRDKYTFYCVAAGIVSYGKYKPGFKAYKTAGKYRAKKGEKRAGFCVYVNDERVRTRPTLNEAKKAALEIAMQPSSVNKTVEVYLVYEAGCREVKHILAGRVHYERTGEMKSMPKTPPKSFLVLPEYEWAYDGVLCDHEYEYM